MVTQRLYYQTVTLQIQKVLGLVLLWVAVARPHLTFEIYIHVHVLVEFHGHEGPTCTVSTLGNAKSRSTDSTRLLAVGSWQCGQWPDHPSVGPGAPSLSSLFTFHSSISLLALSLSLAKLISTRLSRYIADS